MRKQDEHAVQVSVKPGETVRAGQVVAVMSAMKMETTVGAPVAGTISHVAVIKGEAIEAMDLIVRINTDVEDGGAAAPSDEPAAVAA
jgi:pyruvate carboxylase